MLPIIIILASLALSSPVALADSVNEVEIAKNPESLHEYVDEYFKDAPIMSRIAYCESRYRHLNPDGSIFRGRQVKEDIGVMQVNLTYHEATAKKMNINLYSLNGNLEYARALYEKQGTTPWDSSKPCWGKYE